MTTIMVGAPAEALDLGEHWCEWCHGSGLDYGWDGELTTCAPCSGTGITRCTDTACPTHSALHPLGRR